jgi:hypothetical protein
MRDDRLRFVLDPAYAESLGRALFIFGALEWNIVWCCERIRNGYLRQVSKKAASTIASDFLKLSKTLPTDIQLQCHEQAEEFQFLVGCRNGLVHAVPATAPNGAQWLCRDGKFWTPVDIDELADRFAACSITVNGLLHGPLDRLK